MVKSGLTNTALRCCKLGCALAAVACSPVRTSTARPLPPPYYVAPQQAATPAPSGIISTHLPPVRAATPAVDSVATSSAVAGPPKLRVAVTLDSQTNDAKLTFALRAPAGGAAWNCVRSAPLDQGTIEDWCPALDPWKYGAGSYALEVTFRPSANAAEQTVRQEVPVALDDLAIEIQVSLTERKLRQLRVRRVRKAHAAVSLKRRAARWHRDGPLRYSLVNGSTGETLYAEGMHGIYFGTLQRQTSGRWVAHSRGLACTHEHVVSALGPGATTSSEEGHYVGALRALEAGAYRYRLRYGTSKPSAKPSQTALEYVYELRDEFRVDAHGLHPGLSTGEGGDCDPPYTIDFEGLRRVKPQCLGY